MNARRLMCLAVGTVLLMGTPAPAMAATGATERVSVASDGAQADSDSLQSSVSADGRYVAFYSSASNLVPGDTNSQGDVFVGDRQTRTTERVSLATDGTQANGSSGVSPK